MVFSSLTFLFFFLPATLVCYYLVPRRSLSLRNLVLLLFSLLFYFYGEPKLILALLASILANYGFGLAMTGRFRKPLLALCVAANLAALAVFKYLDFFIGSANSLLGLSIPLQRLVMPVGISFYTFQAMSYVIDVYRGDAPPQKNPLLLALYISMFPQLVAGPIVRYTDVEAQMLRRGGDFDQIGRGVPRVVLGLSKKILLAHQLAQVADGIFAHAPSELSAAAAWLGAAAYMLQIYFDFSGYSDMAIGLGRMFGFAFAENFNHPYISRSVTEFWRRWHISLSTWFRDYVYIPLGGNRCSRGRHIFNLLVVWTLTGLWHGANVTFLLWGLYFGLLLIVEKFLLTPVLTRLPRAVSHLYTLFLVLLGWVLFRSDSLGYAISYLQAMFASPVPVNGFVLEYLHRFGLPLAAGAVCALPLLGWVRKLRLWKIAELPVLVLCFLACVMALLSGGYNPFIYFRF